ncbi:hypothetical protein EPIRMAN_GEN20615_13015 [Ralstonia mannitolilytica]|uniref:hypothetical protein n=1 Tax=Ralstonia mannitolilytica TaxID=105219 RepID=UPI00242C240A|nr:hypothetical protein [Ralstonia mannitolilytica]
MAEAAVVQPMKAAPQLAHPNVARVVGKCISVKQADSGVFYHVIALPAPDEYSAPQFVEISSKRRVAQPETTVDMEVQLGGYRRSFQGRDGKQYKTEMSLVAIVD